LRADTGGARATSSLALKVRFLYNAVTVDKRILEFRHASKYTRQTLRNSKSREDLENL
jgi:hypothetical protein